MFGLNGRETPEEIDQNKKLQEVLEIIRTKVHYAQYYSMVLTIHYIGRR